MLTDLLSVYKADCKNHTELRAQINTSNRVTLLAGNMVSNTQSSVGGVSARVYKGGTFGFASSAEYSDESIKNVLKAATDNADFMDKHVKKAMPPLPSVQSGNIGYKIKPGDTAPQSYLIDFANELDDIITKKYKNLTSRTVVANILDIEKLLVVTDGADTHSFQPRSTVYVFMTAETNDGVPVELYHPFSKLGRFDEIYPDTATLMPELDKLYESVMHKREGVYSKAGLCKCVMHPELAGILAHEAV